MNKETIPWETMSIEAWKTRNNSFTFGNTKVGAAVYSLKNNIYVGCNAEHIFRCHDIHAEVNAIGNMISAGEKKIKAILIVADREMFTPCGSCMDWIIQHSEEDCLIGIENKSKSLRIFRIDDLMPYYPK